jgi:hypothetical protein
MLFFNLSNHPQATWGQDQLHAAKQYGDNRFSDNIIVDVEFPNVPPTATREEVEAMAHEAIGDLCERIANFERMGGYVDTKKGGAAVMLAGELSFCLAFADLVKKAKSNRGFTLMTIIIACTERISTDLGDGKKTSQFVFRQFRPLF